jgi:predicted O-methyltransferase YrrM
MRLPEIGRRLGSPLWLWSQARDALLHARDRVSRSEFAELYRTVRPYTMSGNARLRGLYEAVRHAVARDVPGAVVECGTARGGSAALMGLALERLGDDRELWVFDTFEGIPPPTAADPDEAIARLYTGQFRGELAEVRALFERLGIMSRTHLIKGLFQDTVPTTIVHPIAVLHLDGDWYESVKVCLDNLYDRVSRGGVIQIDDYGHWEGARKAVDEFLHSRGLRPRLRVLDYTGRQFFKP